MDAEDRERDLIETRFAGDLRQQFETVGASAGARARRPRRRRIVIAIAVGVAVAVILGGVAVAAGFNPLKTIWPTNEHGQTYGASGGVMSPDDEPDLIAVGGGGKQQGYCFKTDLDGPPPPDYPGQVPTSDLNYPGLRGFGIPMYESDGTTRIGVFWLGGGAGGWKSADGSEGEQTADGHGTIITTTKAADGTITITREALDGSTTTNTAADDPSLLRLSKAERPVTWREITLWFRDVGPKHPELTSPPTVAPDWLAERISAAARTAGDPSATAGWTLQYRRCAAPLEGSAAPTSEVAKYSLVWIAVLHGDFTTWPPSAPGSPAPDGYNWVYLLMDRDSHEVISEGASVTPFDTSMFRLQDGTVTTKTLTAAKAKRLKEEAARPAPSPSASPRPDEPQAWLLERMSEFARDAGDAHATAWWELQWRHYLKPIEGENSPESPYQQWTSVWLVVLHGGFDGGDWKYWLLDRDSHSVLSSGQSDRAFVTSGPQLPAPQGPITLGAE